MHSVQYPHIERVFEQEWRRRVPPVQSKFSVIFLNVASPKFVAAIIEAFQDACAGENPHALAVGDRGGRGHVLLTHLDIAATERTLPQDFRSASIDAPEGKFVAVSDVEENQLAPNNRGGPA